MPEADAKARLSKAFRLREITYQPLLAFFYEDAQIDWDTGRVRLSQGSRNPFTPTLSAAEFSDHFLPSSPDLSELLTLAEQLRLLMSSGMPEEDAKARLGKAFRLRELTYRPLRALPYEDAKIDWDTGRVTLRRLPRDPFTPTLTAAEFFPHFLPSSDSPGANTTAQAALRVGDSAQAAPSRLTEIALDRGAWERQKSRIVAAQQGAGPFPHWDNPAWDLPVPLLDAIRLWLPSLARRLDQLTPPWPSPDEIRNMGQQREIRNLALQAGGGNKVAEAPGGDLDDMDDPAIPASLRGEWGRLVRQWDQWDAADRVVHAYEMAGRLIIEKTRRGQPYVLICASGTSRGDLRIDYAPLDQPSHDKLEPYDFDLRTSYLRRQGGNWFARISSGIDAEAEQMRNARLQREVRDAAAAAAWAAILRKPFRERALFGFWEIAEHLTRKSVVDAEWAKRDIIVLDLDDWTKRQEFDLSGESDVVIRIDEAPFSRPLGPADIAGVSVEPEALRIHNAQFVYLRRPACRRYIEANLSLENAPRLLRDWFPETSLSAPPTSSDGKATPARREPSVNARLRAAIQVALKTLGSPGRTVQWKPFCDRVRAECQATTLTRGYGDRSIQRIVKTIAAGTDKPDK